MNDWLKNNFWNLLLTTVAIVTSWAVLNTRLDTVQQVQAQNRPYIERFIVTEKGVSELKDDVTEIKDRVLRIEQKIDRVLNQNIELRKFVE